MYKILFAAENSFSFFQVVETVRVFVTDANDEPPEFQNLPFIINIPEVWFI